MKCLQAQRTTSHSLSITKTFSKSSAHTSQKAVSLNYEVYHCEISYIYIYIYIYSSSYPSIFWLVGSSPSGIVASHSFYYCITVSPVFLATCFKYCNRGLPTALFPDVAPSRMFTTYSLCLIVCLINEWHLFFKTFKSNLSSFDLWTISSFFILSVHFIFNIPLQCVKKIRFVCSQKTQLSAKLSLFLSYNDMFQPTITAIVRLYMKPLTHMP